MQGGSGRILSNFSRIKQPETKKRQGELQVSFIAQGLSTRSPA